MKIEGFVLRYKKKVKYRYIIVLPTSYGYNNYSEKKGFNGMGMLAQSYFTLPILQKNRICF